MFIFYILVLVFVTSTIAYPSNVLLNPVRLTAIQLPIQTQYHAQDELGQYSYGYNSPLSAKNEIRTADGITRGGYAYLDPNGLLQNVQYIADSSNGFRVAASNLPQSPVVDLKPPAPVEDTAEVEQAKLDHLKRVEEIKSDLLTSPSPPTTLQPPASTVSLLPPSLRLTQYPILFPTVAYNSLILPSASAQYHAQDGLGHYTYGYTNQITSKSEARGLEGLPRGRYAYIDQNGLLQAVKYIVDDLSAVRVAGTNLPATPDTVQQSGPTDTPEVEAAKQSLLQAQAEAKQRLNEQQSE